MIDARAAWNEMVTAALVGLERVPAPEPSCEGLLGDTLQRVDEPSPERRFLAVASAMSVYQSAGRGPASLVEAVPDPCDLDDLPLPGPDSRYYLAAMLRGGAYGDPLPEWLAALSARGKRVPEESLTSLLEFAKANTALWDAVAIAMGKRGAWLAAQNPEWSYVLSGEPDTVWQTGARAERLRLLKQMRTSEPDRARELLMSTWAEETPEDRAAFVEAMEIGLSMADDPFLEGALDDKRKEVRRAAADLLARLPDSRLSQRMIERVRPLISFSAGKKRFMLGGIKPRLEVTLPSQCAKDMDRDGIDSKPQFGMGQKASLLMQMIGAVPLSYWTAVWETTPAGVIAAALGNEWKQAILTGFAQAVHRQKSVEWAEELLALSIGPGDSIHYAPAYIVDAIATDRLEAIAISWLGTDRAVTLLANCKHKWSPALSRAALPLLKRCASGSGPMREQDSWILVSCSCNISPTVYAEAASSLPSAARPDSAWSTAVDHFLDTLKFRHDMLEAI